MYLPEKLSLRIFSLIMVAITLISPFAFPVCASENGAYYDAQAAVAYAGAHWDDGVGVCDQFVKACLNAGGVEILAGGVAPVKNALIDAGFGTGAELKLAQDNVHINRADNPTLSAGDVLFFYCTECKAYIHTAMIGGFDDDDNAQAYGHSSAWDKFQNFGYFKHTASDGTKHSNCYRYEIVHMDPNPFSHVHAFQSNLYESAHPHKMFAQCSCGAKYYLGWNAIVSSCTTCNPPVSSIPVVTATALSDRIVITWSTVENVVHYELYRAKSLSGTYYKISTTTGTKINNTSVTSGQTYYYKVKAARTSDSDSVYSDVVSCTYQGGTIPSPAIAGYIREDTGKPRITWSAVDGAAKYEIYRSSSASGSFQKTYTTKYLSYTNTGAAAGKTYYYKVRAVAEDGTVSAFSNVVKLTLVQNLTAPVVSGYIREDTGKPRITWSAVDGAAKYEIYRSSSASGSFQKTYTTKYLSYTNTGAAAGKTYYYKVRAVAEDGTVSAFSNVVKLTLVQNLTAPVVSGYIREDTGKPRITWPAVDGAAKYEIYRSSSASGTFQKTYTTKYLSYTNTGAAAGKTYYYKVRAVAEDGTVSSFSNVVKLSVK